jgi:protease YdgD
MRFATLTLLVLLTGCVSTPPIPKTPLSTWTAAVGQIVAEQDGVACTASLIAPDVILSAAHCAFHQGMKIPATHWRFTPNYGLTPALPSVAVLSYRAYGQFKGDDKDFSDTGGDWLIMQIEPISYVVPLAVAALDRPAIAARLAQGDDIAYAGYGIYGVTSGWRQQVRTHCHVIDDKRVEEYYGPGAIATDCRVITGDSGGPIMLVGQDGRRRVVIGVVSSFGGNQRHPISVGVLSTNFASHVIFPASAAGP